MKIPGDGKGRVGGGLLLVLLVFFTNSDAKISMLHYAGEAPSSFTLNIIQT
jgi:hypothetical protein